MTRIPPEIDSDLRTEIERQLANHAGMLVDLSARRDALRDANRRRGDAHLLLSNAMSNASPYLISGVARYVLYGDFSAATQRFAEFGDWFVFYEDVLAAAQRGELAALKPKLPLRTLLEGIFCLVLADDRTRLSRLAGPELEQLFALPESIKQDKYGKTWAWFTYSLLMLARGNPPRELADQEYPMRPKDVIEGYDLLLREALRGDAAAFEAQRAKLEQAYPGRSKGARSSVIDWHGAGRIGQAMTFDVIGTVITRLAVLNGLDLKVDSPLYPADFIHRS